MCAFLKGLISLFKLISRFSAISTKIPGGLFVKVDMLILKFVQ